MKRKREKERRKTERTATHQKKSKKIDREKKKPKRNAKDFCVYDSIRPPSAIIFILAQEPLRLNRNKFNGKTTSASMIDNGMASRRK